MAEDIRLEVKILAAQVHAIEERQMNIKEDMMELKANQKEMMQFMYTLRGGKVALYSLVGLIATVGAILGHVANFIIPIPK